MPSRTTFMVVGIALLRTSIAWAYCDGPRAVQVGRVPDIIFPPGRVSCAVIPGTSIKYKAIATDTTVHNCGVFANVTNNPHITVMDSGGFGIPFNCNGSGFGASAGEIGNNEDYTEVVHYANSGDLIVRSDGLATEGRIALVSSTSEFDPSTYPIGQISVFVSATATDNAFTHVVTAASLAAPGHSVMSHPLLDGSPNARVIVTSVLNYNNVPMVFNDHPVSVSYGYDSPGKWSIINTDGAAFAIGAQFNVEIEAPDTTYYANAYNFNSDFFPVSIEGTYTRDVQAMLFPTSNSVDDGHTSGVWYDGTTWNIFNEDVAPMSRWWVDFVVGIGSTDMSVYAFQVSGASNGGGIVTHNSLSLVQTHISAASVTDASSRLFVAPNWNTEIYLASPLGVWWSGYQWNIARQDGAAMPTNVQFNVFKHQPAIHGS